MRAPECHVPLAPLPSPASGAGRLIHEHAWPTFAAISSASKSPNPFWLASAPPTDKEYNVVRAFKAGWGGVVWKTLGEDPPIVNVNGPRYGAHPWRRTGGCSASTTSS